MVPTRQLGKDGPQVTALGTSLLLPHSIIYPRCMCTEQLMKEPGFGLMGLSIFYGKKGTDEERMKFLDYVLESGETLWDSSDVYGDSEDLLGKCVPPPPFPAQPPPQTTCQF